jgi:parvulin-like peptidyl-prolyl isomerase
MRFYVLFFTILFLYGCSGKESGIVLEEGTEDYMLAMKLSEIVSDFDPVANKVIASTNKFDVTIGDIIQRIRANFGAQADNLTSRNPEDLKKLLSEFANSIALTKITLIEAENEGIVVSDSRVDSVIQRQIQRMGGKEKFLELLKENNASEENIYRDIRIGEIHKTFINAKRAELSKVTEEELEKAMESDRFATVRHILLLTQGKSEEEKQAAREKMVEILQKAKNGEDFEELAKQYTEDTGSKANGGLYEKFPRGRMVPAFEEAAFSIPVGEISDIVETPYGYHILKVIDRVKEDRPLEQIQPEVERRKQSTVINDLYEQLKKEYNLQIADIS